MRLPGPVRASDSEELGPCKIFDPSGIQVAWPEPTTHAPPTDVLLDSLYRRSRAVMQRWSREVELVDRHGDSATRALWATREIRPPGIVVYSDTVTPASAVVARSLVGMSCTRADGRFSVQGSALWTTWCESLRSSAWAHLSRGALARREARQASAFVDSAFATHRSGCGAGQRAHAVRAAVRLARADSAGALSDYAIAYGIWRGYRASAERLAQLRKRSEGELAGRFDSSRFTVVADSAAEALRACTARERSAGRSNGR